MCICVYVCMCVYVGMYICTYIFDEFDGDHVYDRNMIYILEKCAGES